MSKKRTLKARWDSKPDLDCTTCAEREECDRAQAGSFCTKWHRRNTGREGQDPNEVWSQGGDAELDG